MVELLAPARDFSALNAAILNGADSVYIGVEGHNLRAHTSSFSLEDIEKAVKLCHDAGKKIYACTNTILKDPELEKLEIIIPQLQEYEVDALIISDLGAMFLALDYDMDVHMSVQTNISNTKTVNALEKLGVKRVILSRELSLEEIKSIRKNSKLEIEVFVHGAMCLALSGRCFLSAYYCQKNANQGVCLQPCRKRWKIISEDMEELEVEENSRGSYILSPKDLCMIPYIPQLIEADIHAFKIEGRARSADYVATVTRVYREAVDSYLQGNWEFNPQWMKDLKKVYHRGFDTGFFFQKPLQNSTYNEATHRKQELGQVENYYRRASAMELTLKEDLEVGDEILIIGPTTGCNIQKVQSMQIQGQNVSKAIKDQKVGIEVKKRVRKNDMVYKWIEKPV